MKKLYFILFFLPLFGFSQNQWQIGLYAGSYSPFKSQMPKMSTTYGSGFHFGYKPSAFLPFSFDWSSTFGTYYYGTQQETYIFDSNSSTTTNVTYTSKMRTHLLGARVNLTNDYSPIKPYIKPQIGWSTMKSKIVIADPNDVDDCQPLDRQTNHAFRGPVYGGEAGVEIDMERMFKNISQPNKHYLFVSASYLRGFSNFEYINQKYMTSHDHSAMPAGSHDMGNEDGRDITTSFVNVTTNEIHDHKIAEVYRTPFEMWGIKIGYVVYF